MQAQIPVELLLQLLNQIPDLEVSVKHRSTDNSSVLHPGMLFRDYAVFWLQHYKRHHVKDNTYQGTYQEPVELHLIPYFGEKPLQSVIPADVLSFFELKRRQGYALETMIKMKTCLKAIYDTAEENKLCFSNPVPPSLRLSSDKPPAEKHCWTKEQYNIAYRFSITHPKGLGIQIMLETGVSRSELLGFQWADFNAEARTLTVNQGLVSMRDSETGKIGLCCNGLKNPYRHRTIPISSELVSRIQSERQRNGHRPDTSHIIQAPRGGPYNPNNWRNREYMPFMEALIKKHPEIPALSPHELRHTVATIHANGNVNLHLVAQLLGHSNLDMLAKRYLHKDIDVLRNALGR